jgi:PadR family transcriptional regulator PadR
MLPKLEEMILLAVLKLGPNATAGDVQAALSEAAGREQAFGSIFTTLDRLADKKFVRWHKGKSDDRRGGRAPRLYSLTGAGRLTLAASLRATASLAAGTELGELPPLPEGVGA